MVENLDIPVSEGSEPGDVFSRSAARDRDGNFSARFSDEPRSRTFEVPKAEVPQVLGMCDQLLGEWDQYVADAEKAEQEAAPAASK